MQLQQGLDNQPNLLRLFGNVDRVMALPLLHQPFLQLNAPSMCAWAASDQLQTTSEDGVLLLLNAWVQAAPKHNCAPEIFTRLSRSVRVLQLSSGYLHGVLPRLHWCWRGRIGGGVGGAPGSASAVQQLQVIHMLRYAPAVVSQQVSQQGGQQWETEDGEAEGQEGNHADSSRSTSQQLALEVPPNMWPDMPPAWYAPPRIGSRMVARGLRDTSQGRRLERAVSSTNSMDTSYFIGSCSWTWDVPAAEIEALLQHPRSHSGSSNGNGSSRQLGVQNGAAGGCGTNPDLDLDLASPRSVSGCSDIDENGYDFVDTAATAMHLYRGYSWITKLGATPGPPPIDITLEVTPTYGCKGLTKEFPQPLMSTFAAEVAVLRQGQEQYTVLQTLPLGHVMCPASGSQEAASGRVAVLFKRVLRMSDMAGVLVGGCMRFKITITAVA